MKAFRSIGVFAVLILCLLMLAGCKTFLKKKKKDKPFIDPVVRIERELDIYFGPLDGGAKTMYPCDQAYGLRMIRYFPQILFVAFFVGSGSLMGDEGVIIMRRMIERLPVVDTLKLSGDIGENNGGYLEARIPLSEKHAELLKGENEDRKKIYIIIGIKADSSRVTGRECSEQSKSQSARLGESGCRGKTGVGIRSEPPSPEASARQEVGRV